MVVQKQVKCASVSALHAQCPGWIAPGGASGPRLHPQLFQVSALASRRVCLILVSHFLVIRSSILHLCQINVRAVLYLVKPQVLELKSLETEMNLNCRGYAQKTFQEQVFPIYLWLEKTQ